MISPWKRSPLNRWAAGFLLTLLLPLSPLSLVRATEVLAAPPATASPERVKRADEAFSRGEKAFKEERYGDALTEFRQAHTMVAHDAIRFNMGICLERLGRYDEALAQFEAAAASQTLDAPARGRALQGADRMRAILRTDGQQKGSAGEGHQASWGAVNDPMMSARRTPSPRRPGWLTWGGIGVVAVGGASAIWFGMEAQDLHDQYLRDPSSETRGDGVRARNLSNISLALAAIGAVAITGDLLSMFATER